MSPNSGEGWPLISNPVPDVVFTLPRLENVVIGVGNWVASEASPPPSQLISRRPLGWVPGVLPLLAPPIWARKASTVSWIDAASAPASLKVTGKIGRAHV